MKFVTEQIAWLWADVFCVVENIIGKTVLTLQIIPTAQLDSTCCEFVRIPKLPAVVLTNF